MRFDTELVGGSLLDSGRNVVVARAGACVGVGLFSRILAHCPGRDRRPACLFGRVLARSGHIDDILASDKGCL